MQKLKLLSTFGSIAVLLFFVVLACAYAFKPSYLDHGEPGVTILSLGVVHQQSTYPAPDAGQRIVLSYGPLVYVSHALGVLLVANPILGSKLVAALLGISALGLSFWGMWRRFGRPTALYASALLVLSWLWFKHFSFWTRPEPLILFGSSLFIVSLSLKNSRAVVLSAGVAIAILVNSKIFAPIYILPLLWLWLMKFGWRELAKLFGVSLIFSALPFTLTQQFPIQHYVYWLRNMGSHSFLGELLRANVSTSLMMAMPSLTFLAVHIIQKKRDGVIYQALGLLMLSIVCLIGSKIGAGPYYLLPCLPALVFIDVLSYEQIRQDPPTFQLSNTTKKIGSIIILCWFISFLFLAYKGQLDTFAYLRDQSNAKLEQDLRQVQARLGESIQMGYGENKGYRITFIRPWLYQQGQEYVIDSMSYWDMQMSQIPTQAALLDQFRQQRSEYWLIPRGNSPFAMSTELYTNPQADEQLLFPDIAAVFTEYYQLVDQSSYFDIWQAKP